ncbi:Ubiquitin-fold modifier-conjugating enzyme 1 [Cooperia oncophora]
MGIESLCLLALWRIHDLRYEFDVEFDIPITYPVTAPEIALPELDGKTAKAVYMVTNRYHHLPVAFDIGFPR